MSKISGRLRPFGMNGSMRPIRYDQIKSCGISRSPDVTFRILFEVLKYRTKLANSENRC